MEEPMKVAVVTSFPPSKVSLNEYGYHLVKNFVQSTEVSEVLLITDKTKEPKQLDFKNSNRVSVKECWGFNSNANLFGICNTVLREKPDAVLFNLQFVKFGNKKVPAVLGLLTPMILRFLGCNTIVLLHNIVEEVEDESADFTSNKLAKRIYNFIGTCLTSCILKADIVAVTRSKYVTTLNQKYKTDNVVLIPHGTFEMPEKPSFDLPEGPKKVMVFGKFGSYKKVEILIDAIQLIRKKSNEAIEIVIAGTDSPNTPGYLEAIKEKYAHVPGMIFTGYVEENELATIFNESTMVVFPHISAMGSSSVLRQAGSYGKAVVLPDFGDLGSVVKHEGYKGEFFNPESTESLAQAIEVILNNDNYRRKLATTNYKKASEFSMDKIVQMYIRDFKQVNYDKILKWVNG